MRLDSQEQIKKPKTVQKIKNKGKKDLDKIKKSKKTCQIKIFLSILIFILVATIAILLFFLIKNKKKSKASEIKSDSGSLNKETLTLDQFKNKLSETNNSITAVYSLKEGEESVFFHPDNIGLSDNNYEIEVLSVKEENGSSASTTLRHLESISYKFLSQITGKIEIRISFYVALTSMFELFKDCTNLVEIDLSKLDASNLKDLDSAFENCPNLKYADLNLPNGQEVQSMDNAFNGCEKLENVDLSEFEPKKNVSIQNMFKNCAALNYVNMLNFHSYNFAGIFVGCLNLVININTEVNLNLDINEIINQIEQTKVECEIGPGVKCKQCMDGKHSIYCDDCNEGYYIPYKKKRTECIKCQDNCLECFGLATFDYCYKCKEGFEPINGICQKKEDVDKETDINKETNKNEYNEPEDINNGEPKETIEPNEPKESNEPNESNEPKELNETNKTKCLIGGEDNCDNCDLIQYKNYDECKEGYYLSAGNETKCKKCSIEGCKSCPNDICTDCFDGYSLNYEVFYPNLTDNQAFYKEFKEMELHITSIDKVYHNPHNPILPPNEFRLLMLFVWNKYKRKMICLDNIFDIDYNIAQTINNEYLQSVIQDYEFTYRDHIYSKDNKTYTYNSRTLKFDEIQNPEDFKIQCIKKETSVLNK